MKQPFAGIYSLMMLKVSLFVREAGGSSSWSPAAASDGQSRARCARIAESEQVCVRLPASSMAMRVSHTLPSQGKGTMNGSIVMFRIRYSPCRANSSHCKLAFSHRYRKCRDHHRNEIVSKILDR